MKYYLDKTDPRYLSEITDKFGTKGIKLDLGCGQRKRDGFVGMDVLSFEGADIIGDAADLIPLPDNSVSEIYSYHVLEHITVPRYGDLFNQIQRVCEPGAVCDFWFPYWTHRTAYDWSHVSYLNEYCFTGSGFTSRFETDRIEYTYEDEFANKDEGEKYWARLHLVNSVKEMRIVFRVKK